MDKLGEGSVVNFKINDNEYGSGTICGLVSTIPNGLIYIIQLEKEKQKD